MEAVIAHDAVDDAPGRAHDLRGQQNDWVQKAPELHAPRPNALQHKKEPAEPLK